MASTNAVLQDISNTCPLDEKERHEVIPLPPKTTPAKAQPRGVVPVGAVALSRWTIVPFMNEVAGTISVSVEGTMTNGELWHSSAIVHRFNSRLVVTSSGSLYSLIGPPQHTNRGDENTHNSTAEVRSLIVDVETLNEFSDGFPIHWATLLELQYHRNVSQFVCSNIEKETVIILKNWTIVPTRHGNSVCVQGIKESAELWHSSAVIKRINARTVVTKSGSYYRLKGRPHHSRPVEKSRHCIFAASVLSAFSQGFPEYWRQTLASVPLTELKVSSVGSGAPLTKDGLSTRGRLRNYLFARGAKPVIFEKPDFEEEEEDNFNEIERSERDCQATIQKAGTRHWKAAETRALIQSVLSLDPLQANFWACISDKVEGRSATECREKYQSTVRIKPKQMTVKKRAASTLVSTPSITGAKGTMKRRRELREYVEYKERDHTDDLFESTPMRGITNSATRRSSGAGDKLSLSNILDLEMVGFDASPRLNTARSPSPARSDTSGAGLASPITLDFGAEMQRRHIDRKHVDVYIRDFGKSRGLHSTAAERLSYTVSSEFAGLNAKSSVLEAQLRSGIPGAIFKDPNIDEGDSGDDSSSSSDSDNDQWEHLKA